MPLAVKTALLLALLVVHFLTRQQTANTMPAKGAEFYQLSNPYTECYQVSLALMASKGFHRLRLQGREGGLPNSSLTLRGTKNGTRAVEKSPAGLAAATEAEPIIEFFELKRPRVSQEEWEAYLRAPQGGTEPCSILDRARVLDIYLTSLIWQVFGISWPVYYAFSSLASTLTCLLIFFVTRRISGSYWAGMLAALLFLASPFENQMAIRSVRDVSPLWFATLTFGFFVCVVDRFRSRTLNYASIFVLGILAMVGRGWRVDVLILIPFLLVALVIHLLIKRRGWFQAGVAVCLFLAGVWACDAMIGALNPGARPNSEMVFHIALYGDSSRCNLMGLENSLQIPRDDLETFYNACRFQERRDPDHPLVSNSREHGAACREMYSAALKYHLFQYLWTWPSFYMQALAAFPQSGLLQGESVVGLRESRLKWAGAIYDWCLDPLLAFLPYLFLMGILALFLIGLDKIRGACLAVFSLYYSVAWFAVLPEQKHLGQLLLPLTVAGGMGLWGVLRAFRFLFLTLNSRELLVMIPPSFRTACWMALAGTGCWLFASALAYPYSLRHRQNYLNDIRALAAQGEEAPETIKDRRVFANYLDPLEMHRPTGYLLTIHTSSNPGYLTCRHVHFPSETLPGRIFSTRHKLYPNQLQYFAVSCFHAVKFGDDRPYACSATLKPGSWIVSCKRLDLSTWKRLPFSTVFCDEDRIPGSPVVGRYSTSDPPSGPPGVKYFFNDLSSEIAYGYSWQLLSVLGLPCEENFEYPGLKPIRLAAAFETTGPALLHLPANWDEANQSSLPLSHWIPQPGVKVSSGSEGMSWTVTGDPGTAARYSPLMAFEEGIYLFKLKYRPVRGDVSFQALSIGEGAIPSQCCQTTQEGDDLIQTLEVHLKAGEPFQLEIACHRPIGDLPCQFLVTGFQAYREKNPPWELARKP